MIKRIINVIMTILITVFIPYLIGELLINTKIAEAKTNGFIQSWILGYWVLIPFLLVSVGFVIILYKIINYILDKK